MFSIYKILWEALSVALLLYGLYLFYAFLWFSTSEIMHIPVLTAKIISATVSLTILLYSTLKWFKKKQEELRQLEEQEQA
ncbi:MAG TPA: hypothetical protein EYH43_01720 [Persephonella sp.]|nr:hypothetical protein [Persephonella sp.]